MDENIEKFVAEVEKSLVDDSFVKLILSNYKGADRSLQKISVRIVETKKGRRAMVQSRFDTRDTVKNFEFAAAAGEVLRHLTSGFRNGHLFTSGGDLQLDIGKRNSRLSKGRATKTPLSTAHDRVKRTLVDPTAFWLKALGITTDTGGIKPNQRDKWRQINKFVEILTSLIEQSDLKDKPNLKIVDMGSGKGYLTFAAYDYLTSRTQNSPPYKGGVAAVSADGVVLSSSDSAQAKPSTRNLSTENHLTAEAARPILRKEGSRNQIQMTGVEQRPELVGLCNDIAKAGNFDGLKFVHGTIADFDPGDIDILIALHACDTATDDALYKGIIANASIIVAAPCCHKEIRKQIKAPEMLSGILKHGIMLERTAETITDGLRALLLEGEGYKTKLFEFIATEHTPKNNMLVGVRNGKNSIPAEARRQIAEIKSFYGIGEQRLKKLLDARP